MAQIEYTIKLRRDTATNWTSNNPVLAEGEFGYEKDTRKLKIGDGTTVWSALTYSILTEELIGEAGGLVPLNESGKIDATYIDQVAVASSTSFTPSGNIAASNVQAALEELDSEKAKITSVRSSGIVVAPSFLDNGDGTVTIGTGTYMLYQNTSFSGEPTEYVIAGGTYLLTDESPNYIQARYNGGTPIIEVITSVPAQADSDKIPIFSCYRSGMDIHYFTWDNLALGLAEKINQRLRRTDRFRIDNGLGLSETPTRVINIASGSVWAGAALIELDAINSSSPEVHFYHHVAGDWVRGTISQYNNNQYDDGNNTTTLTNNKYAVNWIYRSVQPVGSIYVLLGNGDYSLIEAQASVEPTKPVEVSTQSVLVGRIIVLKGASVATQIDRVSNITFGTSSVVNHNDLSGVQGGVANEYYHLTAAEYTGTGTGLPVRKTSPTLAGTIGLDIAADFKVDNAGVKTFGWRDNISSFVLKGSGLNNPTWALFRNNIYGYFFSASVLTEVWATFHIDHDYALGTVVYPHVHWSPNTTSTGVVRWGMEYTVAKGHQQGSSSTFGTATTVYVEQTVSTNSQYQHFIAEVSLANAIPATQLEPDSLILMRFFRDGSHVNDTFPDPVMGTFGDLHYQVGTFFTLNKTPNFYS